MIDLGAIQIDLSRWKVGAVTARIEPLHSAFGRGNWCVRTSLEVTDVVSGVSRIIEGRTEIRGVDLEYFNCGPHEFVLQSIRRAVQNIVLHELDECLFVNGAQLTDPHTEAAHERGWLKKAAEALRKREAARAPEAVTGLRLDEV